MSYRVTGPDPVVRLDMTLRPERYLPSASVSMLAAQGAMATDLESYNRIWDQLGQPEVRFVVKTSLAQDACGLPVSYPVDSAPILAFVAGARDYLSALAEAVPGLAGAVPGLVADDGPVVPVPVLPLTRVASGPITPGWTAAIFPVSVTLTQTGGATGARAEPASAFAAPDVVPSLTSFAADLVEAIPGLHVATAGGAAGMIWAVSLGAATAAGPAIDYSFDAAGASYFALPPLSTAPLDADLPVIPYVTAQQPPFAGAPDIRAFRSVYLDRWLEAFVVAVEEFSSPAYAIPARRLSATSAAAVPTAGQRLAEHLSRRVAPVLARPGGDQAAAADALYQAMLTMPSAAFTLDTMVQVPVRVSAADRDLRTAPRLTVTAVETRGPDAGPGCTYRLSGARVPLTDGGSSATFGFSANTAAQQRAVSLDLGYVGTELELPGPADPADPAGPVGPVGPVGPAGPEGGREGWCRLEFVLPVGSASWGRPGLVIPVPLRVCPSPVTLVRQATQAVPVPATPADLVSWDLSFAYYPDDAAQDTPAVQVELDTAAAPGAVSSAAISCAAVFSGAVSSGAGDPVLDHIFAALAQFTAVWPGLKDDLDGLLALRPGQASKAAEAAVDAFAALARDVASAFGAAAPIPAPIPAPTPAPTPAPERSPVPGPAMEPVLIAPQTFQLQRLNIFGQPSVRPSVSIRRNLELVAGVATNPAFVYRTSTCTVTSASVIVGADPIAIGRRPTGIGEALGTFLRQLLTSASSWNADDKLPMRLAGDCCYPVGTASGSLPLVVPVFRTRQADFDPGRDWDWASPDSFVSRVQDVVDGWLDDQSPVAPDTVIQLRLTIYADDDRLQPLVTDVVLHYQPR